jgi:CDP-glycerol glycerophosphotransferase (TagB/SpsB family)
MMMQRNQLNGSRVCMYVCMYVYYWHRRKIYFVFQDIKALYFYNNWYTVVCKKWKLWYSYYLWKYICVANHETAWSLLNCILGFLMLQFQ